jgi:4-hydroxy-4-methyl-2-oxoglutarate aldolase
MIRRFGLTFAAGAFLASVFAPAPANAQLHTWTKDQLAEYTKAWTGDRFPDGRPKVPDNLVQRAARMSAEEVSVNWNARGATAAPMPTGGGRGGSNQYAGDLEVLQPGTMLVGRAFTLQFMPARGDLDSMVAQKAGVSSIDIQPALEQLQPGDVLVVDMLGQKDSGALFNDNLFYYITKSKKGAGVVIDGSFRGIDDIAKMGAPLYYKNAKLSDAISVTLAGVNVPVRIGPVTVMPGDLVMGDAEGVTFIPPQLAQGIIDAADTTHIHDEWTKKKFDEGKYVSSDIYSNPRDPALRQEYQEYLKKALEELRAKQK